MKLSTNDAAHPSFPTLFGPPARVGRGAGWLRVIGLWHERARQRRTLAGLSDRLLADVGITRAGAAREINKPFWR